MKITIISLDLVSPTGQTELAISCEPEDGEFDIHNPIESLAAILEEEVWYHQNGEAFEDVGDTDRLVETLLFGHITKWIENEHGVAVNIDDKDGYYTFMFSIDRKRCDNPRLCDEVIFGSIQGPMKDNDGNEWYTFLYHNVPNPNHPHVSVIERGASDGTTETDEDGNEYLVKYDESDVPAECQQLVDDLDEYCSECHRRAPIANAYIP